MSRLELLACGLGALALGAWLLMALEGSATAAPSRAPDRAPLEARLDSLHRASEADAESLRAYASEVRRLRGDSLRLALARRAALRRPALVVRGLLPPADSSAPPEAQQEHDQRTLLVSDSACRVEADSLRRAAQGCEIERAFEAAAAAHQIGEAHARADSTALVSAARARRWGVTGVLLGILVALGAAVAGE